MKKTLICICALAVALGAYSQRDATLKKLTADVKNIRQSKASKNVLNKTVINWSAEGQAKITLMDEVKTHAKEHKGKGVSKFKMNQLVTYVYGRQNVKMVSKGDYFNSTEKGINYSAIEKNIGKGKTVSYTITGHMGNQEFVVISYNPKTDYTVSINGNKAEPMGDGVWYANLKNIGKQDNMILTITNSVSNSADYDSFVILNYNPQR